MQLARSDNAGVKRPAAQTLEFLVGEHQANQSAAFELLMQLARSGDAEIQRECVCSYLSFFAMPVLRRPQVMTSREIRDELL